VLETGEHERVTDFFGLPIMLRAVLDAYGAAPRDLSSLRMVTYAMAPMPDEDLRRALETFKCDLGLGFGQTEMSPLTTVFRPQHQLVYPGSVGTQIPNVQTAIMDEAGDLLPAGQVGEIVYRSPQTMEGYLFDEQATAEAFDHGWFHSGDIGRLDAHGVLWFEDRKKDVIKSGGENIASIEIERALYDAEPRIAECVVVGLPDERWGEAATAIVTPKPDETLTEDEVLAAARTKLPGFKVPKRVIFVAEMPHTPTGKVQKNVLREQYARTHVEA
jgi:acyl-CoA synthetase (AMP-forming)/AMP-acid ligase II